MSIKIRALSRKATNCCRKAIRKGRCNHIMFKYLCLFVLISTTYCTPVDNNVDDQVAKDDIVVHRGTFRSSQVNSDPFDISSPQMQDDDKKKLTTKQPEIVEILESGLQHQSDGSYSFHYRGADGNFREETAVVRNPGTDQVYLEINGVYSYFDTDGKEVVVNYIADDKGFVPVGNNIADIISLAAKENSQLPAIKKDEVDNVDNNNDDDVA